MAVITFRLSLLGRFQLECVAVASAGQPETTQPIHLSTHKTEALLAYLILRPISHSREKLATLFWGDSSDLQARNSLRVALAQLHKVLGDEVLNIDREIVQLDLAAPLWIDVYEFQQLADRQAATSERPAPEVVGRLQAAVDLYQGDLLEGFYDEWIRAPREHYRALCLDTLLRLIQHLRAQSEYARAIEYARQVLAVDITNERAHQQLMFCYLATGQRSEALKQYQVCEGTLRTELGVQPASETTALYQWIRQAPAESPSLEARITNLPIPISSFIGREREVMEIKRSISQARLITLMGAGGSGKTRLAIQAATDLIDAFQAGVWWVELAVLKDAALIPPAIAKALGVRETPNEGLIETIGRFIGAKHVLLLLDNCEHLVEACAAIAEQLLSACPHLKILTTSREALGLTGEVTWLVPTLAWPDEEEVVALMLRYEAVRLFVERARAVKPDFALSKQNALIVVQICRRLDGIPLAIELAAARCRSMSVEEIAARLDDRFDLLTSGSRTALPRHQTLRGLIDWSYDLLSPDERILFRRLAVFVGGQTLEAAQVICASEDIPSHRLLDLMTRLLDKSLLLAEENDGVTRYYSLETIRQYALEKLAGSGEAETLHDRHLHYFLNLAEEGYEKLRGPEQTIWLNRFEAEQNNSRAALSWALARDLTELAVQLIGALWLFWDLRSYLVEGCQWSYEALTGSGWCLTPPKIQPPAAFRPSPALARALHGTGYLTLRLGDRSLAVQLLEQSVTLWRVLDDPRGLARALNGLGQAAYDQGDLAAARSCLDESLTIWRCLNEAHGAAVVLNNLGAVAQLSGDYASARAFSLEALDLWRARGDRRGISGALLTLAENAQLSGDYEHARVLLEECLPMQRELGLWGDVGDSLHELAVVARALGDHASAQQYALEGLALQRKASDQIGVGWCLHDLGCVALNQNDLAEAAAMFGESLRIFRQTEHRLGAAACLAGFGALATAHTQLDRAVQLFGAARSLLDAANSELNQPDRLAYGQGLDEARARLDPEVFDEAWNTGRALMLDQAIELALNAM